MSYGLHCQAVPSPILFMVQKVPIITFIRYGQNTVSVRYIHSTTKGIISISLVYYYTAGIFPLIKSHISSMEGKVYGIHWFGGQNCAHLYATTCSVLRLPSASNTWLPVVGLYIIHLCQSEG